MSKIYYTKPSIGELERAYVNDAVTNGWGEQCYAYIQRFEREFAARLGVSHAVATSSCTGALHLGLRALDIGPGDEVILADMNWIASAAPVCYVGAQAVLVDVLPDSWCLDPAAVARAITPRTKAIIAVHLYGNLAALAELRALATAHGLALIEDAAEALGSRYQGRCAGAWGDLAVFSFHGTKLMTTGEGGMLVTNNAGLCTRVEQLNNHGRAAGELRQFWPAELGHKYKMSNIQAALGCAQLERLDELLARKRAIFAYYARALLPAIDGAQMNPEPPDTLNSYWMPTLMLPEDCPGARDAVLHSLAEAGVDARLVFQPLSRTPVFAATRQASNPQAAGLARRGLNLPSYHELTEAEQDRVIAAVLQGLKR